MPVHQAGPSWEYIAVTLVSIVIGLIFAYQRGMSSRLDKIEQAHAEMNRALLSQYHPKQDVKEMMDSLKEVVQLFHIEMKVSFKDLKERFDKFESIYGR